MTWEEHWRTAHTPWDVGAPSPTVVALADELPRGRALVPGCGRGWDAFALASPEREVVALDLAPSVRPHFEQARAAMKVPAEQVSLLVGDFFDDALVQGPFDLVWDYTFLCALDPSERGRWASRMAELVRPGGTLATLLFPVVEPPPGYEGPPWPLDLGAVAELLADDFERARLEPVQASHEGREGKEWLGLFTRRAG